MQVNYHQVAIGGSQSGRVEKSGRVSQQANMQLPPKMGKPPLSRHMAYQNVGTGERGDNFGKRDNSMVDSNSRESAS